MEFELDNLNLFKDWQGSVLLCLNEDCMGDKFLVLKSETWTQGALLERNDFQEGELEKLEMSVKVVVGGSK